MEKRKGKGGRGGERRAGGRGEAEGQNGTGERGRVFKKLKKSLRGFYPNSIAVLRHNNKRHCANTRRRSEAKHCSSLCLQSEGDEYCGGQTRLKIQQSHGPEHWPYSLRVRGPHFASKVSYNAGAATDDYAALTQISAARALLPIFNLEHPGERGRSRRMKEEKERGEKGRGQKSSWENRAGGKNYCGIA